MLSTECLGWKGEKQKAWALSQRAHCLSGSKMINMTQNSQLPTWVPLSHAVIVKQDKLRQATVPGKDLRGGGGGVAELDFNKRGRLSS